MKQVWPNYYSRFSCIAQNCKHTCCAGWEIDVDKDTLAYYQTVEGEIGKRLRENIIMDADGNAQFRLSNADRIAAYQDGTVWRMIIVLFRAKLEDEPVIKPSRESTELQFFSPEELKKLDIVVTHRDLVGQWKPSE